MPIAPSQDGKVVIGSAGYTPSLADQTSSFVEAQKRVQGVQWLVPGWIPYGMITGIVAKPKAGKSGFVMGGPVRQLTLGEQWFDGSDNHYQRPVIWCDTRSEERRV